MPERASIRLDDIQIDPQSGQLRPCGLLRPLRAKSRAVLHYLARNSGRLVTHEELRRAVWPRIFVTGTVLRVCVAEIRAALGEGARRFLVTIPGRGYLFGLPADGDTSARPFVGRRAELARLYTAFARAQRGCRRLVFVRGEAGAGKTWLLDRFLDDIRAAGQARVASGQCLELNGGPEPYGAVLDLLGRLCDELGGDDIARACARWAPSWLQQLPGRYDPAPEEDLARRAGRPIDGRMLRELSGLVDSLAAERPLVLVLHDVHWSDASTIDAISYLAQRDVPTRLLIVCTHRPDDTGPGVPSLTLMQQALHARGLCEEILLGAR